MFGVSDSHWVREFWETARKHALPGGTGLAAKRQRKAGISAWFEV